MKLPDIQYRRNVPQIRSGKMAALPTKLRNIDAAVGVTRQTLNTVDKAIESEAKIDSNRRLNEAKRGYVERVTALTQDYHSDPEKDASQYQTEVNTARYEAYQSAGQGAGARTQKYLAPSLDHFTTQVFEFEQKMGLELIESRQRLKIDMQMRDSLATVGERPDEVYDAYDLTVDSINTSSASAEDKVAMTQSAAATYSQQALNSWANDKNVAAMSQFPATEMFDKLNVADQQKMRDQILASSSQIVSEVSNVAFTQVARSEISPERAMEQIRGYVDGMGLEKSAYDATINKMEEQAISAHINSLLALSRDQEVLDIINSGKYDTWMNAQQVPSWINQAHAGLSATTSASTTLLMDGLKDQLARVQDGVPMDTGVVSQGLNLMADPSVSQAKKESIAIVLEDISSFAKFESTIADIPAQSSDELENDLLSRRADLSTLTRTGNSTNYRADKQALESVIKTTEDHLAQRQNQPMDYAVKNDPTTRARWRLFNQVYDQFEQGSGNVQGVQQAFSAAMSAGLNAQRTYGVTEANLHYLPQDPNLTRRLTESLTVGTKADKLNAMATLQTVMGSRVQSLVGSMYKDKPNEALTLAFASLPNNAGDAGVEAMLDGANIRKAGQITSTQFRDSLASRGVEIPQKALGDLYPAAYDSIFTYAAGIATEAELQSGVFEADTLERSRDAVIGPPVRVNGMGNPTVTFRKRDGAWMPAQDLQASFYRMGYDNSWAVETFGQPYFLKPDGTRTPAAYSQIMGYATPVMVRNGKYALSIPASSPAATNGVLVGADGKRFELDMLNAPPVNELGNIMTFIKDRF